MRANVGALIAWLRACVINGWLGNQAFNPELIPANARLHRQRRQKRIELICERTIQRRLRLGRTGGGRNPPRARGAPTRRDRSTDS